METTGYNSSFGYGMGGQTQQPELREDLGEDQRRGA